MRVIVTRLKHLLPIGDTGVERPSPAGDEQPTQTGTTTMRHLATAVLASLALAACGGGGSSSGARGVVATGSSTVFPFAQVAAEQFTQRYPDLPAPTVESIGTGAGIAQFCNGVGEQFPDIADASRRMKKSEYDACVKNGVTEVAEIQIGIDGIALGESLKGPKFRLTSQQLYEALAAEPYGRPQTNTTWSDIDPSLPGERISVYGPPSTSGTRDAFIELIMVPGCESDPAMKALKESDEDRHKAVCERLREDGAYVDTGENDNLIVQKLEANPTTVGIFGYSYLEANTSRLRGVPINGVEPTYASIASFDYPGARPLYLYVKKQHVGVIPGLREFLDLFPTLWGKGGKLAQAGMIAAPDDVQAAAQAAVTNLPTLDASKL